MHRKWPGNTCTCERSHSLAQSAHSERAVVALASSIADTLPAGLALGVMMSRSTRVREDMLLEAAKVGGRSAVHAVLCMYRGGLHCPAVVPACPRLGFPVLADCVPHAPSHTGCCPTNPNLCRPWRGGCRMRTALRGPSCPPQMHCATSQVGCPAWHDGSRFAGLQRVCVPAACPAHGPSCPHCHSLRTSRGAHSHRLSSTLHPPTCTCSPCGSRRGEQGLQRWSSHRAASATRPAGHCTQLDAQPSLPPVSLSQPGGHMQLAAKQGAGKQGPRMRFFCGASVYTAFWQLSLLYLFRVSIQLTDSICGSLPAHFIGADISSLPT